MERDRTGENDGKLRKFCLVNLNSSTGTRRGRPTRDEVGLQIMKMNMILLLVSPILLNQCIERIIVVLI